jgi:hypothetical protein
MNADRFLVAARLYHLVFWAGFGFASAGAWWSVTYASQPGVSLLICAIGAAIALTGVYDTWATMTEFEA